MADHLKYGCVGSFEIVGDIMEIEIIAVGPAIREIARLRKLYGDGRWRKLKGIAVIRLASGRMQRAEIHWHEAQGIGKKRIQTQALFGLEA